MRIQTKVGMSVSKYNKHCTGLDNTSGVFTVKGTAFVLFLPDKSLLYIPSSKPINCGCLKLSSVFYLAVTVSPMSNFY